MSRHRASAAGLGLELLSLLLEWMFHRKAAKKAKRELAIF